MNPDVNVGTWIAARAAEGPERTALIVAGGAERISFAALDARIDRTAAALRALGLRAGDRVAVALRSEPLFLELYFAAAKLGAIFVPLNTRLAPPELAFQIADSGARLVVRCEDVALGPGGSARVLSRGELLALRP